MKVVATLFCAAAMTALALPIERAEPSAQNPNQGKEVVKAVASNENATVPVTFPPALPGICPPGIKDMSDEKCIPTGAYLYADSKKWTLLNSCAPPTKCTVRIGWYIGCSQFLQTS
ncbi:hypothetical protein BDR26DRAFT_864479 [Obelidium mucronatum]|nr:hypothetical protein BDR26DRAFT_864479 [Obelidium mucronatum]